MFSLGNMTMFIVDCIELQDFSNALLLIARPKSCSMPYSTFTFYMLFVATFCCGQKERPEKWTNEKEEFKDKETLIAPKQNERRFDGKSSAEHGKA